jgi:hypothetical protein
MKSIPILLFALLLSASGTLAGEVYGTITDGSRSVPAGVKVEIGASGHVYSAETDKFGSYRIYVKEKGKCTLTVRTKDQAPTVDLYSYDKSTRYDWVLEAKDGKLSLRRK